MKFEANGKLYKQEHANNWFLEESVYIVTKPDGENVAIPMSNWHWFCLDWMCNEAGATLKDTIEAVVEGAKEEGMEFFEALPEFIAEYIHIKIEMEDGTYDPRNYE